MMDIIMQPKVKELTDNQFEFIETEFGISKSTMMDASEEQLDELYDKLCDVEVEETIKCKDTTLSDRGKYAESLVTLFGNAIAEFYGYFDDVDYEYEEEE